MTGGVTKAPTATTSPMIGYGWRDGVIVAERVSLMAAPPLMNAATALSPEPDCGSRTDQNGCVRGQRRWREGVTAHLAINSVRRIVINTVDWRMRTRPDSVDDDHGQHSAVLSASPRTSFESASAPAGGRTAQSDD